MSAGLVASMLGAAVEATVADSRDATWQLHDEAVTRTSTPLPHPPSRGRRRPTRRSFTSSPNIVPTR
jgi:hypothetical protein